MGTGLPATRTATVGPFLDFALPFAGLLGHDLLRLDTCDAFRIPAVPRGLVVLGPTLMRTTRTNKTVGLTSLLVARDAYRRTGRTVVWTNGCFDLLHAGHVRSLQAASRLGDVLVVGANDDEAVRRLKGPGRPILPAAERAEALAALECVDHVLVFAELTPVAVIEQLRPDVHCKGAEYAPPHGRPIPELAVVEAYGGRVAFLPLMPGLSTTELLRRIRQLEDGGEQC